MISPEAELVMDVDISKIMTYEIKKEIAGRYFGFRKLIEEDKEELARRIKSHSMTIEQKIVMDLARIYILLQSRELIRSFLELAGLEEEIFYDEYMISSPTIKSRVFTGIRGRGLTRTGRLKNLFLGCYEMLVDHVGKYREKFSELLESHELISEEIKLFYRKNDISSILDFLRSLEDHDNGLLTGPISRGASENLEKKMMVTSPPPIEYQLPIIPPLVPLARIRREMKKLAEEALKRHPEKIADLI